MQYDVLGRLVAMVQPGALTTARAYDANGNVLVLTDPKGQTVTSTYDEWSRVKTKVYAFAPGDAYRPWRWLQSVAYVYDANDNPIRVEETVASGTDPPPPAPNQITTRTYDDFDRMLSETVTLPDGGTKTVSYTYFKNGNRKTVTDPAGIVTSYTYDGQNRLETVTTSEGVTTYTYWPDDLLKTVTYPSGVESSYGYDLADRLTSLESRQGATVVSSYAYTYDANGNRLTQTETNGGAPETTTYTYDARDRLETVTYPPDAISATGRLVTYTYDEVGNRLTELTTDPVSGNPLTSKSGTFDALNRLTVLADLLEPPATVTFDYDDNGNQSAKKVGAPGGPGVTTAFRYDVRDKLVEVETPTVISARFQHDADGRLSKKIGEDGIRQYVYDEDSRFLEYDTAGLQVAKYSYGADRLISLVRADEGTRFYHLDGLGSVTALTDFSGAVASRLHLDAWGVFRNPEEMNGPSVSKNRFAFTGYVFDRETELYFAKARFYDPTVGRFASQDSFLGELDRPPSLHRYFYAAANPLRYVDPTGHAFTEAEKRQIGRQFVQRTAPLQRDKRPDHEKGWWTNYGETFFAEFTGRLFSPGFKTYEGLKNMSKLGDGNPRLFIEGQLETVASAAMPLVVKEAGGALVSKLPVLGRSVSDLAGAGLAKLRGALGGGGGVTLEPMVGSLSPIASVPEQLKLFPDAQPLTPLRPLPNVGGGSQGAEAVSGQLKLNLADAPSSGTLASDPYVGVRTASRVLRERGVPRQRRIETLQAFEAETMMVRPARPNEYGLRYFDAKEAYPKGRFLFETFPSSRQGLALKPEWNQMRGIKQWRIREAATLFDGRATSQGIGLEGGAMQKYIPDLGDLIEP